MMSAAEAIHWQCETGCLAAEMSACVIGQVRGMRGIEADGLGGLHKLRVEGGGRCVCVRRRGQFFLLVWQRRGDWRDLMVGAEG